MLCLIRMHTHTGACTLRHLQAPTTALTHRLIRNVVTHKSRLASIQLINRTTIHHYHTTRNVVVTGMGMVSPLGPNVQLSWQHLRAGMSGVRRVDGLDYHQTDSNGNCDRMTELSKHTVLGDIIPSVALTDGVAAQFAIGAPVLRNDHLPDGCMLDALPDQQRHMLFNPSEWIPRQYLGSTLPFVQYALAAAMQAMEDAKWHPTKRHERERTGVAIGSGIGGIGEVSNTVRVLYDRGPRRVSPYFVPKILANSAAGLISIVHDLRGPNHTAATACTTGVHSIGDAARMIKYGDADVMLAGSTEACINAVTLTGFGRARALSTSRNDTPWSASRPFDADRDGFVMGEGAGVLVLEDEQHAQQRGARIYARVSGYGMSGDAHHVTSTSPDGRGARRSMQVALADAGIDMSMVDFVNAHATSTPTGDMVEAAAIASLRKDSNNSNKVYVGSNKGAIGHTLGAAGSIESIFAILSIRDQVIPKNCNLNQVDSGSDGCAESVLDHIELPQVTVNTGVHIEHVLKNSFGFGGTNASLVFSAV
jgi:3-oxoacyl-[acyl-carrier-protein] synthase II